MRRECVFSFETTQNRCTRTSSWFATASILSTKFSLDFSLDFICCPPLRVADAIRQIPVSIRTTTVAQKLSTNAAARIIAAFHELRDQNAVCMDTSHQDYASVLPSLTA